MNDWRRFISFVRKEFLHILRDTRTLMVLLVMPVLMIILFGFALSTEIKNVKVAVFDPSHDAATTRIINQIASGEYFTITANLSSSEEIIDVFRDNTADIALVFEENFYQRILHDGKADIQLVIDGSNTNIGSMALYYVNSVLSGYYQELAQELLLSGAVMQGEEIELPITINTSTRMLYNPQMKSAFNFVPGVMGMILMLVCAMMTSVSIVREKERGNMEVLLVSPVKPFMVIIAKVIPYFVISIINLATIILLSTLLLKVPISGSLGWIVVVSLIFIMVSLSIGMMVSTLVSKQEEAILISSMVLMLPTLLLSGMLFPIEGMPTALQYCSYFVPAKWYIDAIRVMMIQGLGIKYCLNCVLILLGFLGIIVTFSVLKFKDRL